MLYEYGSLTSVITSKPANDNHRKTGQWDQRPGPVVFYSFASCTGKPWFSDLDFSIRRRVCA
jgi:hypothetical protein